MSNFKRDKVNVGDWVRGFAKNGALIQGYMENIDPIDPLFKIRVIDSDDKDLIGYTLNMDDSLMEKMQTSSALTEPQLNFLIDIALETNDKEWFLELSNALKNFNKHTAKNLSSEFIEFSIEK
ncbi:IDEAL domain-containing protein [Rossellomorea vietnamensis]|uniref:IDEAL domain-containing protein n=1 Tax=Rossellomorea vietnamensis TaxID=218284 RepID=A0A5D4MEL3_9BACI|nr:IDEAL domain-containing protein [Rossellomorea vietnamensis]TYS00340.1 IDEAL domain-containing protein [Rossellomorea vietnamensis]